MTFSTTKGSSLRNLAKKALIILFWLFVWQLIYWKVGREILVVSPFAVAKRLFELSASAAFWLNTFHSVFRIISGFALGVAAGTALAVAARVFPIAGDFLAPVTAMAKATPVASFILLALVWMKSGSIPVLVVFLIVFPIIYANVSKGIQKTDKSLLEMAKSFKFARLKTVRLVYIPLTAPYFTAAVASGFGMAWKAGVAAEVLCTPRFSMGSRLRDARIYQETLDVFAWTFAVIILSIALEKAFNMLISSANRRIGGSAGFK